MLLCPYLAACSREPRQLAVLERRCFCFNLGVGQNKLTVPGCAYAGIISDHVSVVFLQGARF